MADENCKNHQICDFCVSAIWVFLLKIQMEIIENIRRKLFENIDG
jgi:hypothetical protein